MNFVLDLLSGACTRVLSQSTATLNVGGAHGGGGSAERQRLVGERAALLATNVYVPAATLPALLSRSIVDSGLLVFCCSLV
jgi:hypothetical protein